MLLLTDRARKVSAILSSVWMLTLTLLPTVEAIAADAAFTAGQSAGQAGVTSITGVLGNPTQIQGLGITGLGTQVPPSSLTDLYKGGGKNGADSIGALNAAGVQAMQSAQTCAAGDASCQARNSAGKAYQNQLTGQDPRAKYKQTAEALRHAQMAGDPLAILGIGIPNAGGGSVCVESTATVPSYQTTTSCLQATFQTLHSLPVLPVTTGSLQTSPYCIDPAMTLSSNQSLCSKTTYSCPNGGTLNGTSCVINSIPVTTTNTRKVNQTLQESGWGNGGDRSINTVSDIDSDYTISGCGDWSGRLEAGKTITLNNAYYNGNKWSCGFKGFVNGQVVIDTGANSVTCWDSSYNCVVSRNVDETYALPLLLSGSVVKVIDGDIPGNGTAWNDGSAYIFGDALTYSVNDSFSDINAVLISADNNDIYRVDFSMDGVNWDTVADIDPGCCWGIFQNTIGITPRKAKYVRVYPVDGDGAYSIAELQLLSYTNTQCTNGGSLSNNGCSQPTYPATSSYQTASPGCLGAPIPSGNTADGGTQLVAGMVNGQAGLTCQTTYYSCPATMNMNGMLCEDPSKPSYQNPNCKYLGKDTNTQGETYLCLNNQLDECAALDLSQCTNTNNACIFTDNVVGSNTYGQCIATQKDYSCTVPAQTTTINQCGYDPMCYNGNCFTPPGTNCKAKTIDTTKTEPSSCNVITQQVYRQCSLVEQTNAQSVVTGYTAGADCANINNQGGTPLTCTQIPATFDATTGHYPQKINYSCLSAPVNTCSTLASTAGCSASSNQCLEYQCLDPVSNTIGSQEQAGTNTTSIVGSVSAGAVPTPSADMNTCVNKGSCINEQKTYNCTTTTSMPGDECTTDLSQVLVSMETARQAGSYMDQNILKIFSGEFSRCDRRAVGLFGANLGSKSCCNIDAPDPKNNAQLFGSPMMQGVSLLGSGISAGSSYMYDYMMSSQKFATAAQEMWAAGALTDNMAQQGLNAAQSSAESLANFNFSPSVSLVPGFSIGYGALPAEGTVSSMLGAGSTTTTVAGATATSTTTVAGISTTTTTTAIGNTGFNMSYNPTMLYVTAAMMAYQAYQAALACDEEDYKSSTKGKAKLCYNTGTWCESKDCGLFGCTCTKYRTGKCCYNSKLARIINQQGRAQLGLDIRTCDGFTVAQIQQLDWSKIDLTEFIADMLAQAQQSAGAVMNATTQTNLQNKLTTSTKANGAAKTQPKLPISQ